MARRKRRTNGEGTITKLPSGSYRQLITLYTDANGKQVRKSFTAPTMVELQKRVSQHIG